MSTATKLRYTPEEYLSLERKSPTRNQYFNGEIFAMAGASREHNLISANLLAEIRDQLLDRPCEVYQSDMRVLVEASGLYTYPDVVVVCGEPRFLGREVDTLLNPTVIAEVLSESTEAYDRGAKFRHYRRFPTLREYVIIAQDRMSVERYTRRADDWVLSELNEPDQILRLESIGCEVRLERIYAKVTFGSGEEETGPVAHPA
jgi:Uma2 family endonuclease